MCGPEKWKTEKSWIHHFSGNKSPRKYTRYTVFWTQPSRVLASIIKCLLATAITKYLCEALEGLKSFSLYKYFSKISLFDEICSKLSDNVHILALNGLKQGLRQDPSILSLTQAVSWKYMPNIFQTNHFLGHGWSLNFPFWHKRL